MLDKRKIRLMIKMSMYEKTEGREDFKISSYYKRDYVSMQRWLNVIWITIGYGILVLLFSICNLELLMKDLTISKLLILFAVAVIVYLILLIGYGGYASSFYKKKHTRAKQHMKKYYRDLSRLEKMDMKERQ